MSEFNTGLPSVRQIQNFIKEKRPVEVGLITDKMIKGQVLWQDSNCLCIVDQESKEKTLVWLSAMSYIKPSSTNK